MHKPVGHLPPACPKAAPFSLLGPGASLSALLLPSAAEWQCEGRRGRASFVSKKRRNNFKNKKMF